MHHKFLFWCFAVLALLSFQPATAFQEPARSVLVLTASGPVTPAMAGYLERGLRRAAERQDEALIFQLNTPGGGVTIMNEMLQDIRASQIPVVVFVAPPGAMAGSAGTLITLAGHVAAMAPETAIGAASPINATGQDLDTTSETKEKNILKATARSLAERRGPQAVALAEATIESAEAASATEALAAGLIDFIAEDIQDLLKQMDGFSVETSAGQLTLHTQGAAVEELQATFLEGVLGALTNPNIVFILLNIGVLALIIELSSPGGWLAGSIGVVCLALAMYSLGVLPVNWFGLVFLVLAFALFLLDIKAPTHGGLTAAGVASLIAGALILFNSSDAPGFPGVSVPLVVGSSIFTGGLFFSFLVFALRALKNPIHVGQESLVGRTGFARTDLAPSGIVQVGGESWSARLLDGQERLPKGSQVEIMRVDGLKLIVRRRG